MKLTCKQVSELVSREHEQPLSWGERFRLRLHLLICAGCRNFRNNVQWIRTAMKAYLEREK